VFDSGFYRQCHPDLSAFTDSQLWDHYVAFGLLEERIAHPSFSLSAYLRRYPDLRAAHWIKGCHASALHHWNLCGKHEGRSATPEPGYPSATPLLRSPVTGYGLVSLTHALRRVGKQPGQLTGQGVVIAVIDSGVDPGIVPFWTNPGETLNQRDDDGDGFVDNIHGWDFVDNDPIAQDSYHHGTPVAQIAHGIAPGSLILPLRILDSQGYGTEARLLGAIDYAINKKARIINLSLEIPVTSAIRTKLKQAVDGGAVVCLAAGNKGLSSPSGTAAIADEIGAVAVGCVSSVSNRAGNLQNYVCASGEYTSLATPVVSGLVALLLQGNPNLNPPAIINIMTRTASNVLP
jgi:subtilisin family serine protease